MKYENECGSCENSDCRFERECDISPYQKYYCDWYRSYYFPDDSCDHYRMFSRDSVGCYITTVMCDILGYTDKCFVLSEMRNFRNNVMQQDERYFDTLLEYDVLGPKIAEEIKKDFESNENKDMWTQFYKLFLSETANLIAEKEYDKAVSKYRSMVMVLKDYFAIPDVSLTGYRDNYDMKKGGHGKVIMLPA